MICVLLSWGVNDIAYCVGLWAWGTVATWPLLTVTSKFPGPALAVSTRTKVNIKSQFATSKENICKTVSYS